MLIDGHALAYRAYHAFPPLTTKQGELVNAVYGFSRILLTVLRDVKADHLCACFDLPKPTFRHEAFSGYKATRKEMPDDLRTQIERIKSLVATLNIPEYSVAGYEADDVIGTIAKQAIAGKLNHGALDKVLIVTGDRDAFQLVTDKVHVYMPPRNKEAFYVECGPKEVEERMGITPEQIIEYKALAGDASDNIPGVKGVGDKTAVRLLQAFGSTHSLYEAIANPSLLTKAQAQLLKPKLLENLAAGYESMVMSKTLATIDTNVPIELKVEACVVKNYDKQKATQVFEELGFKSLIALLPKDKFEEGVQSALF